MENVHHKIEEFVRQVGLVNAPMFMQGFVDGDTVRFYDPGLRYPGGEYERMFLAATGKNLFYPLIEYALTGQVSDDAAHMEPNDIYLCGKTAIQVLPTLRAGTIAHIEGLEQIRLHPDTVGVFERFRIGDTVKETHNVNQRFCEIDLVCASNDAAAETVRWVYETLKITDENGEDMLVSRFDPDILLQRTL